MSGLHVGTRYARSLTGTIPTELGRLTDLSALSFYEINSITGSIPSELGQLHELTYLEFYYAR